MSNRPAAQVRGDLGPLQCSRQFGCFSARPCPVCRQARMTVVAKPTTPNAVICDGIDARAGTGTQIMLEWMYCPVKSRLHSRC